MQLNEINDVIDATQRFKQRGGEFSSDKLGSVKTAPGHTVDERPSNRGDRVASNEILSHMVHEIKATIYSMIDSPDDYGYSDQDMAGLDPEQTLKRVAQILYNK